MSEISLLDLFKSGFNEATERSPWLKTWKAQVDRLTTSNQAHDLIISMLRLVVPAHDDIRPHHVRWLMRKRVEFYHAAVGEDANGETSDH